MSSYPSRTAIWDNLKFFLILSVVVGHFVARFSDLSNARRIIVFVYLFHMPAFMYISGVFSKSTVRERKYSNIFRMLFSFVFIKLLLFTLVSLINQKMARFSFAQQNDVSWYAFVLFIFYLLAILFDRFNAVYIFVASVVLACFAGFIPEINTWWSLARLFSFFPFFWLGIHTNDSRLLQLLKKKQIKICSVMCLLTAIILSFCCYDRLYRLLPLLKGKVPYESIKISLSIGWCGVMRFAWYGIAFLLIFSLISVFPERKNIISLWGSRTFSVYAFHYVAITVFFGPMHGKDLCSRWFFGHSVVSVCFVSLLVVILFSQKPFLSFLNFVTFPGKNRIRVTNRALFFSDSIPLVINPKVPPDKDNKS